jgi:hypothetical protein
LGIGELSLPQPAGTGGVFLYILGNRGDSSKSTTAPLPAIYEQPAKINTVAIADESPEKKDEERVMAKLKAIAAKNWPDDFSTQEYWINEEIEAYKEMKQIPDNSIKRKAQRNWPYDFSTQKYWYNEQIEAKERLNAK